MHPWLLGSEVGRDTYFPNKVGTGPVCYQLLGVTTEAHEEAHHWYLRSVMDIDNHRQWEKRISIGMVREQWVDLEMLERRFLRRRLGSQSPLKDVYLAGCPRYASIEAQSTI